MIYQFIQRCSGLEISASPLVPRRQRALDVSPTCWGDVDGLKPLYGRTESPWHGGLTSAARCGLVNRMGSPAHPRATLNIVAHADDLGQFTHNGDGLKSILRL